MLGGTTVQQTLKVMDNETSVVTTLPINRILLRLPFFLPLVLSIGLVFYYDQPSQRVNNRL